MAEERVQRRLAAILVADVVGYSRLIEADEEGTRVRLRSLQAELIDPRIAADGGRIVKTSGDGILVEFGSAVDAVRNALAIQEAMSGRDSNLPEDRRIRFRVGINVGDVIVEGDDIHGEGVNVAARLEGLCAPGEVYISRTVYDQAIGKLAASFEDLGEQTVKNITRPLRVFRVRSDTDNEAIQNETDSALPLPDKPSIAVLPFENMSRDPEQEFFADGIAEDIITALSRFRWFFVIARNSSFTYKGRAVDVKQVARELGVQYVLEGSVRTAGNRVRITAQLIDALSGRHVWADRYDRELDDIFAVQDEITQAITARVEPEFVKAEQRRMLKKPATDLAAWEWYQRGISALFEASTENHVQARKWIQRAIELDPNDSAAHSAMAYWYYRHALEGYSEAPNEDYAKAVVYGKRAVALDESDSFAHFALHLGYRYTGDHDLALAEVRRSIELNPNHSGAHVGLGNGLSYNGNPGEGIPHLQMAMRLSPEDPRTHMIMVFTAEAYLNNRDYEQAVAWARKSIVRKSEFALAYAILAAGLAYLDRIGEAKAALSECLRLQPRVIANRRFSVLYKRSGDAEHILDGLRKAGWEG